MVKIIHTADWQLGKPFNRFSDEVRAALTEARFDVIDRIGALAADREISHVLVAGDVFDNIGPADRDLVQALTRMGRFGCHWWLMPGNHDHARADGLWTRVRSRALDNVHVIDAPQAVEIEVGTWVLPAPLEFRRTRDDPTSAMSEMETPAGAVRIGLAHGSVVDFAGKGEADNKIPLDRATQSGLDYLALGDWHEHRSFGDRTAYSGTPEVDRFGQDGPGAVIVADVRRGVAPVLERVETGRYRWLQLEFTVQSAAMFEAELGELRQVIDQASTLLKLRLTGTVSLADRVAIHRIASDDLSHALRWLALDDSGLLAAPTDDDIANIDMQGTLAAAAAELQAQATTGGPDGQLAMRALERLYVEALRATSDAS